MEWFGVRVSLERFFSDERARVLIGATRGRSAGWLTRRVRRTFCLPRAPPLALLVRGHLLPPGEPLAVLAAGDVVEVIPASFAADEVTRQPSCDSDPREPSSTGAVLDIAPAPVLGSALTPEPDAAPALAPVPVDAPALAPVPVDAPAPVPADAPALMPALAFAAAPTSEPESADEPDAANHFPSRELPLGEPDLEELKRRALRLLDGVVRPRRRRVRVRRRRAPAMAAEQEPEQKLEPEFAPVLQEEHTEMEVAPEVATVAGVVRDGPDEGAEARRARLVQALPRMPPPRPLCITSLVN